MFEVGGERFRVKDVSGRRWARSRVESLRRLISSNNNHASYNHCISILCKMNHILKAHHIYHKNVYRLFSLIKNKKINLKNLLIKTISSQSHTHIRGLNISIFQKHLPCKKKAINNLFHTSDILEKCNCFYLYLPFYLIFYLLFHFNLTAVPKANISEAPVITVEVVNLIAIIASAPRSIALLTILLNASSLA